MTVFVALLRAVNVSGTARLLKEDLKAIGERCRFDEVSTYINSGNMLFQCDVTEEEARRRVEAQLADHFGRPWRVHVRTAIEMAEAASCNPFTDDKPSRVMAHFIDSAPTQAMLDDARDVRAERLAIGPRLIYVSYGAGIGKSRLKLPAIKQGTARNMNSVAKLAELLAGME